MLDDWVKFRWPRSSSAGTKTPVKVIFGVDNHNIGIATRDTGKV
jgi:hypothetical protein